MCVCVCVCIFNNEPMTMNSKEMEQNICIYIYIYMYACALFFSTNPRSLTLISALPSLKHARSSADGLDARGESTLQQECVCCISRDLIHTPHICCVCGEKMSDRESVLCHLLSVHNLVIGELDQIADLPK